MDYGHCTACEYEGPAEEFSPAKHDGGDWEECPRCGSMNVEPVPNASRPDPRLVDARDCLESYNSVKAAASQLAAELGETEGRARTLIGRAIRADVANRYGLDHDEVSRAIRLAVTGRD